MQYIPHTQLIKIKQHLKSGGIIAYATESCYGIGCNPFNYKAIHKIIRFKKRLSSKGMIVISGARKHLINIVNTNIKSADFDNYWPGSYSLILPSKNNLPKNLTGRYKEVAVRVTKHKQVIQLTNYLQLPLVSTSANRSGMYSIKNYRQCKQQFGKQALVIKGITNFAKKPSTIIHWQTKSLLR